jgi:hypothetical protein
MRKQLVRLLRRRTEGELEGLVDVRRGDALHLLQGADAALRLARLGRLGAKARDERLQVRDGALLLVVRGLLQREARGALRLEVAVVAAIRLEALPVRGARWSSPPRRGIRGRA